MPRAKASGDMVMGAARIFISHKNKDEDGNRILPVVADALKNAGFDVLVDRERLKPGRQWRDEIYTWMGLCHGAVILLSRSARDDSIWVPRETSILLWRRTLDPAFVLIPVFLDGLSESDFSGGGFADLNLREIQGTSGADPAAAATALVTQFSALKSPPPTPLEEVAEQIATLFRDIDDKYLQRAADTLHIDLGPWDPAADVRKALALRMLQVPLAQAGAALDHIAPHFDDLDRADRCLDLVEPSWVDLCAARWVAQCARQSGQKPILVLNAHKYRTAELYVRRASCRPPKLSWPIVAATGVYGEAPDTEAAAEIEQALARQFRINADRFASDPAAEERERLRQLLVKRDQTGKPVFVVLPPAAVTPAALATLQTTWPLVTFLVLTGDEMPDAEQLRPARVHLVEPRLGVGSEVAAHAEIDLARSSIRS